MRSRVDLSQLAAALGGLPILGCLSGSSAAQAGVRYGDVLLAIDGIPTSTWDDFLRARQKKETSRGHITARIFRDGVELEVDIELRQPTGSPLELLGELIEERVIAAPPQRGAESS